MSDVKKLYEMLKKVQEEKGYYFNKDKQRVYDLLEALLINKERYGYMSCPCRLASKRNVSTFKTNLLLYSYLPKR